MAASKRTATTLGPRPQFLAPTHAGSGKLAGVAALITGGIRGPAFCRDAVSQTVEAFGKSSAMGRLAQPEKRAPARVFLAAPSCASYISGAVLPVMGGPTG